MEWTTYKSTVWTIMQKKKNSDTFASLSDRRQGCLAIWEEWHLLYQECLPVLCWRSYRYCETAIYRPIAPHFECRFIEKQHFPSSELFLVGLSLREVDTNATHWCIFSIRICIRGDQERFVLAKTWWNSSIILGIDVGEVLGLLNALN
jgi:hypothetical protein